MSKVESDKVWLNQWTVMSSSLCAWQGNESHSVSLSFDWQRDLPISRCLCYLIADCWWQLLHNIRPEKTLKNAQWHKVPYGTSQTRIKWFLFFIFFTNIISIDQNKRRLWSIPNALTVILKAATVETKWSIQAVLQLARPQVKSSQTRNCCLFGTVNLFISQCGGKQTTPVV